MSVAVAILTAQEVHKSYGTRLVLDGVSFAIHERDRVGILGLNGSGKSTLLRLCAHAASGEQGAVNDAMDGETPGEDELADLTPDQGRITRRRGLRLAYVPQEPRLPNEQSVAQALEGGLAAVNALKDRLTQVEDALGKGDGAAPGVRQLLEEQAALHERLDALGGWDPAHELRGIAAALQLPPMEARVGDLSIGERRRVALARALLSRPDLLILDEPTNHLDARTVEWLEGRLLAQPGTLLLVTHDRYFLDRVATRILELDRGQLYAYEGGYHKFLEKQAERLATELHKDRLRSSFIRRELSWIRRGPQARGTKQKARIDRFNDAVGAQSAATSGTLDQRVVLRLPTGGRLGKTIMEMRSISKSLGGKRLFQDLSLMLKPGDRIGIVGENGAGKTTLVRVLMTAAGKGGDKPVTADAGEVIVGSNTRVSYLDQGRADLDDERTVLQEVAGDSEHVHLEDGPVHVRTFLRMMLFDDRFADTPVGTLSGGERNRVQLAKLLRQGGNLLVLDEPTNDLDLLTLGVLEEALEEFPGCALVVSHDRWFLDRVATGILAFEGEGRVVFHEGNYSDYWERRKAEEAAREAEERAQRAPRQKAAPVVAAPVGKRLSFKEQRELAGMEAAILEAEERAAALSVKLEDPTLYRERGAEVAGLVAAHAAAKAQVEALYARWQELEQRGS